MIEKIRNAYARKLCKLAQEDAGALQLPLPDHLFGFVAQQSAEKFMKALLCAHDREYPKTHNLRSLLLLLEACSESMPSLSYDLTLLQPYAADLRYDEGVPFTSEERIQIQHAALAFQDHVLARILELEAAQV